MKVHPLVLALLMAGWAAAQDNQPQPLKVTTKTCGSYSVRLAENGFDEPDDKVSLIKNGKTYVTLSDTMVEMQQCGDITGDGIPEVVLMQFSGGAHCCATHSVYSLTTPPRRILETFTGHGDSLEVEQLDGRGPKEIVNTDWRFAYDLGMSFADSPALPRIYSLVGGQYVENTRAFPAWLLKQVTPASAKNFAGGDALYSYSLYLLAGKPAAADAYLKTLPKTYAAWLNNYAPDIRQRLSSAGIEDWPARAGVPDSARVSGIGGSFSRAGTLEYLGLIGSGQQATLRLYRAEGNKIVGSGALATFTGSDQQGWFPSFTVRRSTGRDDAVVADRSGGGLGYPVYRVGPQGATRLTNDPLAVASGLLADVSTVAQYVQRRYDDSSDKPLSAAQIAELDRKISLSAARAQPWAALLSSKIDLPKLGMFSVNALEVSRETAQSALVAGTVEIASVKDNKLSYDSGRYTVAIFLENRGGTWMVSKWQLTPRTGNFEDTYPAQQ
ncbi:hypothetical protein Dxin01_03224 [Deinococcus xinjiangensis]|uniref:Uncharacterized protein n=1 Tax=Deinococcus xinjiangensis TaxID=457454 RepID=A0ABP9VFP9_9DEIO